MTIQLKNLNIINGFNKVSETKKFFTKVIENFGGKIENLGAVKEISEKVTEVEITFEYSGSMVTVLFEKDFSMPYDKYFFTCLKYVKDNKEELDRFLNKKNSENMLNKLFYFIDNDLNINTNTLYFEPIIDFLKNQENDVNYQLNENCLSVQIDDKNTVKIYYYKSSNLFNLAINGELHPYLDFNTGSIYSESLMNVLNFLKMVLNNESPFDFTKIRYTKSQSYSNYEGFMSCIYTDGVFNIIQPVMFGTDISFELATEPEYLYSNIKVITEYSMFKVYITVLDEIIIQTALNLEDVYKTINDISKRLRKLNK